MMEDYVALELPFLSLKKIFLQYFGLSIVKYSVVTSLAWEYR